TGSNGQTVYTVKTIDNPNFTTVTTTGAVNANSLAVTNNATVGGTLGVTGNTTVGGTLNVTNTANLNNGANLNSKQITGLAAGTANTD
ncbi:hypothetical protein HN291_19905, partial [Acinetobacter baumannii]|nr:hypothetical protein [Acinetobacter baumannii]